MENKEEAKATKEGKSENDEAIAKKNGREPTKRCRRRKTNENSK